MAEATSMTSSGAGGPPGLEPLEVAEAADAYVAALVANGVEYLFLNPGTDTFPVQEAVARLEALGRPVPRVVLCPYEGVALAAAHGYYAATGRAQAVLVHVDVGTQNLGGMVHNAQRGRAAVLLSAGRAPYTTDPAVRGTRNRRVQWLQDQLDQHGIVRGYVKWDYEVRRPDLMGEVVARAFQVATSDPPGPVYVTLPREVLMEPGGRIRIPGPDSYAPARLGAGDPDTLQQLAAWLVEAERPVVVTATAGRSRAGFDGLVGLAELLALPVVELRERVNFPADHPLHQGYDPEPWVAEADLVLVVDHDVPYIPTLASPPPGARVVQLDVDPVKERMGLWSFPVHLAIPADSGRALPLVARYAEARLTQAARRRIQQRRQALQQRHLEQRARWEAAARQQAGSRPIAPEWLAFCLGQMLQEAPECIFVAEGVTNGPLLCRYIEAREPESWFESGGSALGWGLGAAMGVRLARSDRPVVALVGDGSFLFSGPLAALWTARSARAPLLVVIFNNAGYKATKQPLVRAYPDGYSARTGRFVGVDLFPSPNFERLAGAVEGYGERVEDPAEVLPALRRGLERVRVGELAVLNVVLARS